MSAMASQITSSSIVYSTVSSGADQRKHQSPAPLAFVSWIHRWPVNSPHKEPVTRIFFSFDNVIMFTSITSIHSPTLTHPHPPSRSFTRSLLLTNPLNQSLTVTRSFIHSPSHSFIHSWLTHSLIHPLTLDRRLRSSTWSRWAALFALFHDNVMKWKHFPRDWPFVSGIHRSPVDFPHKGQ